MTDLQKIDYSTRQPLPDLIRVWALLGIVLVNVGAFAWPIETGYYSGGLQSPADYMAYGSVTAIFMAKSYALFSLMFGMGLAFQINSALRKGVPAWPRHFRRMIGLFVLGLLHASFFFIGDVLITYAVIGCLLYTFRLLTPKGLAMTGIALLVAQAAILMLIGTGLYALEINADPAIYKDIQAGMTENAAKALTAFGSGSFMDATAYRLSLLPLLMVNNIFAQGMGILGYFLLGLAIVKKGYINTPQAAFWHKCRWVALPIGLFASLLATYMILTSDSAMSGQTTFGIGFLTLGAPLCAFGYAGWIAKYAASPPSPLKAFLARAGTATLSAYLLQSVILSYIFSAYGLGLYAKLGAAQSISIGLLTGIISIVFVSFWRLKSPRGPVEALLRRWTYLEKT